LIVTEAPAVSPVNVAELLSVSVPAATTAIGNVLLLPACAAPDTEIFIPATKPSATKSPDERVIVSGLLFTNAIVVSGPMVGSSNGFAAWLNQRI
jgi:hypothetical protein